MCSVSFSLLSVCLTEDLRPSHHFYLSLLSFVKAQPEQANSPQFGFCLRATLLELVKGLKIMGKFSRHLQDMVAVATGLLIW